MVPEDLATYTPNQLEQMAINDLKRRPDVEHSAPINLERLVDGLPNVSIEYFDNLVAKHRVVGMVLKSGISDQNRTVLVDSQVAHNGPWSGYNAVLGEEYAHLRIHQSLFLLVSTVADFISLQSDPQWHRHEADARRFSDAIRMPADLLEVELGQLYPRLTGEYGFGDTMAVHDLVLSRLASKFRVSMEDIKRRMQQPQVRLEDRLLSSLQSRSGVLIPEDWVVTAQPRYTQGRLFETKR